MNTAGSWIDAMGGGSVLPMAVGIGAPAHQRLALERFRGHTQRPDVDVEERTALPGGLLEEAALAAQALVERCARERRHDRDLDVELAAVAHEALDRVGDPGTLP